MHVLWKEASIDAVVPHTLTEYWRPARIQGDSVRLKNISADWFCVFNYNSVESDFEQSLSIFE